jgi:ketosteroid isomerase-like protein
VILPDPTPDDAAPFTEEALALELDALPGGVAGRDNEENEVPDLVDMVVRLSQPLDDSAFRQAPPFAPGSAAIIDGAELVRLCALPDATQVPAIATRGVVRSTRLEHIRMLRLLRTLPADLQALPAPTAVAEFMMRRRKEKQWRWATTLKYLATCQGALASLPLLRHTNTVVRLQLSPIWTATMRATARLCREELPSQPRAASWMEVSQVLRTEPNILTFAAILLSWLTASRIGCVLQLSASDVTTHTDGSLSVRFQRGKGVLLRGQCYTVHTGIVPANFLPRLQRFLSEHPRFLFPQHFKGDQVRTALRRVNRALEQRSLRRGALQALALAPGITDETLLLYSGHSNVRTLRRYLNWGVAAHHTRAMMAPFGTTITTSPTASSPSQMTSTTA